MLMFVRTISSDHIEVGFSYKKSKEAHERNNESELFNNMLAEFREQSMKSLQFHINVIQNFPDPSLLTDTKPLITSSTRTIAQMTTIITNHYIICLGLVLFVFVIVICYWVWKPFRYWDWKPFRYSGTEKQNLPKPPNSMENKADKSFVDSNTHELGHSKDPCSSAKATESKKCFCASGVPPSPNDKLKNN